ncbi:MAG TPA: hypothetical protein DEQ25_12185 [Methylophaga sp.]|jgi:hypothetical protein|nr:hypothetical protein [Methylophaga sp.]HCC81987.1 hypothetical protein [Methylophaga sp.]
MSSLIARNLPGYLLSLLQERKFFCVKLIYHFIQKNGKASLIYQKQRCNRCIFIYSVPLGGLHYV